MPAPIMVPIEKPTPEVNEANWNKINLSKFKY